MIGRSSVRLWWLTALLVTTALIGAGPLAADPETPGTAISADRYGVVVGSPSAPVQLEVFCDPQCPDCARFESRFDADISRYLGSGKLAVTYRWLTFLDDKRHNDTSARVSKALMLAADPTTTATAYQALVADLYRHRAAADGPSTDEIAAIARESGVPEQVVSRITAGAPDVDTAAMNIANRARLNQVNPESPTTPTVYNPKTETVVNADQTGWLDRLVPP